MNEAITFNDVLIKPKFSMVESRKDVELGFSDNGFSYMPLPVISANMDSITGSDMSKAMLVGGAQACLHRFQSIEDNVKMFTNGKLSGANCHIYPFASIGLGKLELERAEALVKSGCQVLIMDLAHGAQMSVVRQVKQIRELLGYDFSLVVGNFATSETVRDFMSYLGSDLLIQGLKVGVGCGSRCKTRVVTGVGQPQLSTIIEISQAAKIYGLTIIADGGMDSVGDISKALGAGAHMVMSGSFFAGTDESPGEIVYRSRGKFYKPEDFPVDYSYHTMPKEMQKEFIKHTPKYKKYRGSASQESYDVQGKTAKHRTPEGDSTYIPYKGPVANVLQEIEGGLRSAFTYTGSRNLEEFHRNVEFIRVSSNTVVENGTRNGVK